MPEKRKISIYAVTLVSIGNALDTFSDLLGNLAKTESPAMCSILDTVQDNVDQLSSQIDDLIEKWEKEEK